MEIREVTEIRDILPTLLDAAQASVPERIDGQSLLRLVREPEARWRAWIDLEHGVCYDKTNHWTALTDGRWKYIHHAFDGSEQLFNLDEDPGEKRDLVADSNYNPQREEWRQRMVRHLEIRGDGWVREGALVAPRENQLYSPNYPGTKT